MSATMIDHALALAARGFEVFPVRSDKKPTIKGWQKAATRDKQDVHRLWSGRNAQSNIGISTTKFGDGEALIVVDVDRKPDRNGEDTLFRLDMEGFALPDTLEQETPRGGRHLIFRHRAPVRQGANALGPAVDIRSKGGYIVAPGSTVNGKQYRITHDRPIAQAPDWLVAKCGRVDERPAPSNEPVANVDADRARRRATDYLWKEAPLAVEGDAGDATTYLVCCKIKDMGLDEAAALTAMTEDWNDRCSPPWGDDELAEKVANAYRYGREPVGAAAPETQFEPIDGPISFAKVLQREPRPVRELVEGLIERGIATFLDGPGGSNKSRLALQIGLSVAAGIPIFGRAVEQCAFIYLSSEDDADEVTRRTHAITERLELPRQTASFYWDRKGKDSALAEVKEGGEVKLLPFYSTLRAYLQRTAGHKLVAVDSIYDFVRYVGKAKIDEGSVNAFIKRTLGDLCTETDCSLLVIRHPSAAGADRGDFSGWSVANHNAPRARLSMHADARDTYILKVEKRNHGPIGEPITLHWSAGALMTRNALAAAEEGDKLLDAVVDTATAAAEAGQPLTQQRNPSPSHVDMIERISGIRPTVKEVKDTLVRAVLCKRLVYINGHGKIRAGYFPADKATRMVETGVETRLKPKLKPG